jgi:NADPH:quinone reductase-like Zn-dependent oxidoreductase
VRSIGADHVIDYAATDVTRTGERYGWIVDTDSHHSVAAVRRALTPDGVYVTLGGDGGPLFRALLGGPLLSMRSDRWMGLLLWWKPFHPPDVAKILELVATANVRPVIDRTYPLDRVAEALRHVNDGRARGKVVITVS